MKLYFTPQTLKKIIKLLLLFILISIIIFYSKTLNVQAKTIDIVDNIGSTYDVNYSTSFGGSIKHTYSSDRRLFPSGLPYNYIYPLSYYRSFKSSDAFDMFATYSDIYVKTILHFRFYYDILNENYFNPFPGIYSTDFHESSSDRSHGGGGVSFSPDTSGDENIYDESKFWKFKFFEDLDIYDISYSYTADEIQPYYDIYVYCSKLLNSSNYSDLTDTFFYTFHQPTADSSTIDQYKKIPALSINYFSYFEIKTLQLSDEPSNLFISNYYDEDSCLFTDNCDDPFADDEESSLIGGLIDDIVEKIKDSFVSAWKSIKSLFSELFIPSSSYFNARYESLKIIFNQKFGIFIAPIDIFINFIERFLTLTSEDTSNFVINVPEYKIPGFDIPILKKQSYNLSEVLNNGSINRLWILYLDFIDCFMIISFLNFSWNKLSSFFGGMSADNTYYSVDDIETYNKETGERIYSNVRFRTTRQVRRKN